MPFESKETPEVLPEAIERLRELRNEVARRAGLREFQQKIIRFAQELKARYPDCSDYAAYHVLISSTPSNCDKFDFPGDDSVTKWLEAQQRTSS